MEYYYFTLLLTVNIISSSSVRRIKIFVRPILVEVAVTL